MRENIGGRKGTYNPELAKATRLRFAKWREAALKYIAEHGVSSDYDLLKQIRNSFGRPYQQQPHSCNALNNLLGKDKRFLKCGKVHRWGAMWGLNDEPDE
tara:strand:+ start:8189 stop:8488 length:300 start_codon:yes stop_codon:yes gene_type:complete